jgi:phosphoribosylanthranilate isomerase
MLRTRIKICGVRDAATAQAAAAAGADAIGLVFVRASPRFVTLAQARKIIAALPAFVEPIGLFVDTPAAQVLRVARALGLRTVQVHGQETPAYAARLAPLRVIKGIGFTGDFDTLIAEVTHWRKECPNLAAIIWDAPPSAAARKSKLTGGSGRTLDWKGLAQLAQLNGPNTQPRYILAGGLTPTNVAQAVRIVRPFAVDVSSGVESSRGVKDPALIRAFCAQVRRADNRRGRED